MITYIRKITRFTVATLVWLHALFLMRLTGPDLLPVAAQAGLTANELVIILALAGCMLLSAYGWKNILIDLAYIYFFPFVAPCVVVGFVYRTVEVMGRALSEAKATATNTLIVEQSPLISAPTAAGTTAASRQFLRAVVRALTGFTVVWGLLVVETTHPILMKIATLVVVAGTVKAVYAVLKFGFFSTGWVSELESKIQVTTDKWIACVTAWNNSEPTAEVKEAWNGLKALEVAIGVLRKRQVVLQWTITLAFVVFAIIYSYVALLFSFSYVGVAHLLGIAYRWPEAITTSLLLPISFADLPHSPYLRLLGAVQYLFVVIFGVGTIFGYLKKKVDSIQTAAALISLRLERDEVRNQFVALEKKIKPVTPAVSKVIENKTA